MYIEKLKWDSDFFGYNVGKVIIPNQESFQFSQFKRLTKDFKLIYIFSAEKIQNDHLKLVDQKVIFNQKLINFDFDNFNDENISFFDPKLHIYSQLEDLALISGIYSRFSIDENFRNNEYKRLYIQWVKNSVENKRAFDVLVYYEDNQILGFITINKVDDKLSNIGLVAVSDKFRGRGVGTKLIEKVKKIAYNKGFSELQVVTQNENLPAIKLYEKCNFRMQKLKYIYHFWNI